MRSWVAVGMVVALLCTLGVTQSSACTVGVVSGSVTRDGRSIMWKNRDNRPVRQQRLSHYPATEPGGYAYIGVHTVRGGPTMGLNEAGLASGNSRADDKGGYIRNGSFGNRILATCATIEEVHAKIERQFELEPDHEDYLWLSGCFPFIDAQGEAIVYELSKSKDEDIGIWFKAYDAMNSSREAQNLLGIVPRANTFHRRDDGTDNLDFTDHYQTCRVNVQGLRTLGILDATTLIQGSPDREFEVLRYSHYGDSRDIARWWTFSAIVVQGVKPGEDPALTTMWTLLGKPDYCLAVPAWVRVSNIPEVLAEGAMWDRAESLFEKGERDITHASIFPAESHIFEMVNTVLLPHWREKGVPPVAEMERVQHRIANDAYSLLDCLDNRRNDNMPPQIGAIQADIGGVSTTFSVEASDPDGEIVSYAWDFGDGTVSEETSPRHDYSQAGTYLISCTVTDNDDVSITSWRYITVGDAGT